MTLEELRLIPLQYTFGYSAEDHAVRQYVSQDGTIAKQVYTPRNKKTGMWGAGQISYLLVATKQEFETIEGLLEAINAREVA